MRGGTEGVLEGESPFPAPSGVSSSLSGPPPRLAVLVTVSQEGKEGRGPFATQSGPDYDRSTPPPRTYRPVRTVVYTGGLAHPNLPESGSTRGRATEGEGGFHEQTRFRTGPRGPVSCTQNRPERVRVSGTPWRTTNGRQGLPLKGGRVGHDRRRAGGGHNKILEDPTTLIDDPGRTVGNRPTQTPGPRTGRRLHLIEW